MLQFSDTETLVGPITNKHRKEVDQFIPGSAINNPELHTVETAELRFDF